jgi:uncharacterized damage-inducible protein DinB
MLSFTELLDYTDEETARWEEWLRGADSGVLETPIGGADRATVRELIAHIFIVEHRYADRLHGDEPVSYQAFPAQTLDELFAIHRLARARLRGWVAAASDADWAVQMSFQTLTAGSLSGSRRKIVAHALLHGIRHWAQIATTLRQHGHPQPWMHDLLMSSALA